MTTTALLDAALDYSQRLSWPVFPVHGITDLGHCTCGDVACRSPGKHPVSPDGHRDATLDPDRIRALWTVSPNANIGIPAGAASGIDVLDIDPRNGGDDSLAELERTHGSLKGLVAHTGGGGRHLLYRHRDGVRSRISMFPGLDVRGEGGSFIAPPSRHFTGGGYTWGVHPPESSAEAAEWPDWLHGTITRRSHTMNFKRVVDSLDGVDEAHRGLYEEKDGKFHLTVQVEGESQTELTKQLDEFRSSNRELFAKVESSTKALEEAKKAHDDALAAVKSEAEKSGSEKGKKDSDSEYGGRIDALEEANRKQAEELAAATTQRRASNLHSALVAAAGKHGAAKDSFQDVAKIAATDFSFDDNDAPVVQKNGVKTLSANRPGQPMDMDEYMLDFLNTRPHYQAASRGDGGGGGGAGGGEDVEWIDNDPVEIGKRSDDIASGKVKVRGFGDDA